MPTDTEGAKQIVANMIEDARKIFDSLEAVAIAHMDTRSGIGRANRAFLQVKLDEARNALSSFSAVFEQKAG